MSREVVWQPDALDDFDAVLGFLTDGSPAAAAAFERKVSDTLIRLAHYSIGRPGRVGQTFEKPLTGTCYTLVYGLSDTTVSVLRIIHQRRQWPEDGWPQG
ncbi:plasmid stabilization protein [Aureimonas sp. SA4125]|uniref:type II toxin-antitoxin system RelE/ParE family toxin n=1 Tax=Aureimonas sp. SA4125 TaxID=2826993 RepID=UPI001CC59D54|nr:type II toxin-antitoxin system RelE/ParE family toxin [Aureimonas sp. SA4125]BDA87067.1 plasmid stabilization protein [Aureimonas sp. SA4125]